MEYHLLTVPLNIFLDFRVDLDMGKAEKKDVSVVTVLVAACHWEGLELHQASLR